MDIIVTFKPVSYSDIYVQTQVNGEDYGDPISVCPRGSGIDQRGLAVARIVRDHVNRLQGHTLHVNWNVGTHPITPKIHDMVQKIMNYNLQVMKIPKHVLVGFKMKSVNK